MVTWFERRLIVLVFPRFLIVTIIVVCLGRFSARMVKLCPLFLVLRCGRGRRLDDLVVLTGVLECVTDPFDAAA